MDVPTTQSIRENEASTVHGTIKRPPKARRNRSAVTSRRRLFADRIPADSPRGRRFTDLVRVYTEDLGGDDRISEATRNHIRHIALLQCVLEDCEADYVKTGSTSQRGRLEYQRLSNTQSRLMKNIGLLSSTPGQRDDDEDDLDPLTYAERGGSRRSHRERLGD
ncbi:hypothetical protein I6F35_31990 [Bradyrhizobium sp. BRP22]|uniref:hypothetical protein n=1 Tax=Bradyrhizobium sp. BRP22 TaxID=2793821 RepID=UPI001CD50217|nr:hypothetical protein [Bradyrhizobium sp. BRP22]MCA1457753.1 hypothetical protein [Bradyrhizobium sp. BRP22]